MIQRASIRSSVFNLEGPFPTSGDTSGGLVGVFFVDPWNSQAVKLDNQTTRSLFATVHGQFFSIGIKDVSNL